MRTLHGHDREELASSDIELKSRNQLFLSLLSTVFVINLVYLPIFSILNARVSFAAMLAGILILNPTILSLHRSGFLNAAKCLFILSCNLYIYAASLGTMHKVHAEIYCVPALMIALLIFDFRQKKLIAFGFFLAVGTWILIKTDHYFLQIPSGLSQAFPFAMIQDINFFGSFAISGIFLV